jgi:hypothetical protein
MKKLLTVAITGLFAGLTMNLAAQSQPGSPAPQASDTIKVTGCLKNEKDVAGLKPNIVERAGITEDYILTDVKPSPDSKVSGIGLGYMYEIEGIKEGDLKAHLNHQIELTGQLSRVETGAAATNPSNRDDVPDFHATSFKMLAATCPMK